MPKIISVHSFRGGTGKSNLVANMATLLAMQGRRVGIVDTDIQSPGVHVLFGFDQESMTKSLNDYLWGKTPIEDTAYALHDLDDPERPFLRGLKLWLIPCSVRTNDIAKILREGYDVNLLQQGFYKLVKTFGLDYLIIDTHPGLDEETLLSIAIAHTLVVILRPDRQDVQGTAVTVEIARKLDVPKMVLVINSVPSRYDFESVKSEMNATYHVPVAGVLPLSEDVVINASGNIFCAIYPDHPWTKLVSAITNSVIRDN
jgi:MinD-like ATPase involved in chromosome partitioning or flagellar assembly